MHHGIVPSVEGARRRATYADVLEAPEHLIAEIIEGELITSPRPAPPHALAGIAISSILFERFNAPVGAADRLGGWWILYEPELHVGDDVLVPDVAGWKRERLPAIPNAAFFDIAPDWVCEVISPSSGRIDRTRKMPIYAREHVQHLWLVDPTARTLEVYRLDADRWIVDSAHGGPDTVHVAPFDAAEVDLRRWWGEA